MSQTTLTVFRVKDTELRFLLQRTEATRAPVVLQASTVLRPEQRQQIHRSLQDFAECVVGRHTDEPRFAEIGQVLHGMLLPELIQNSLQDLREPLVIATDDPTLPWEVLHDGNEFLSIRLAVSRQLIEHRDIAGLLRPQAPAAAAPGFCSLVIADPIGDLPGARAEGEAVAELFRSQGECELLVGAEVTWEGVQRRLVRRPYSVIHYCGHMEYDAAERISSIPLRNDSRLAADDIAKSFRGSPVVFLNACSSDTQGAASATDTVARTESFVRVFMIGNGKGVASAVVGTMWRVPDEPREAASALTREFYQTLFQGGALGDAMRTSRVLARNRQWGPMVWGPYVLYGDPSLVPIPRPLPTRDIKRDPNRQVQAQKPADTVRPTETAPPTAPPPPPDPVAEVADTLGDAGRDVLRATMREMAALGQRALTSVHLLLGVCTFPPDALVKALDDIDLDADCLATRARKRAKRRAAEAPGAAASAGISETVLSTFKHAIKRAARSGGGRITSEDLLAGLLRNTDSEAVHILDSFGISADKLLARLTGPTKPAPPPPAPPRTGSAPATVPGRVDAQVRRAFETADAAARGNKVPFLGTPHLLVGLLTAEGGGTAEAFRQTGIDPDTCVKQLADIVGVGSDAVDPAKPLPLRGRVRDIFQAAAARVGAGGAVTEAALLAAVLDEKDGETAKFLRGIGADRDRILGALRPTDDRGGP